MMVPVRASEPDTDGLLASLKDLARKIATGSESPETAVLTGMVIGMEFARQGRADPSIIAAALKDFARPQR